MKFLVSYFVGKEIRERTIEAESLEGAEQKCNNVFKSWIDVKFLNIEKRLIPISAEDRYV